MLSGKRINPYRGMMAASVAKRSTAGTAKSPWGASGRCIYPKGPCVLFAGWVERILAIGPKEADLVAHLFPLVRWLFQLIGENSGVMRTLGAIEQHPVRVLKVALRRLGHNAAHTHQPSCAVCEPQGAHERIVCGMPGKPRQRGRCTDQPCGALGPASGAQQCAGVMANPA